MPKEVIDEIAGIQKLLLKKTLFSGKLTESSNLHLTLKFLGEVSDEKIEEVKKKLGEIKFSEFFEKISPYHFNNSEENINNYSVKRVSDRFNKIFPHIENQDHYFDKYNIENPIPFDFEKRYDNPKIL